MFSANNIGVYMSGGLDSATLLCLLLANSPESIPVTCFTVQKKYDNSIPYAPRVVQQISKHFNRKILHVLDVENDPDAFSNGYIGKTTTRKLMVENPGMKLYMGLNRSPLPNIKVFKHLLKIRYGDHCFNNPAFASPFLNTNKTDIIRHLYDLGCEHIIPYTKSCSVSASHIPCNDCYACEERAWGFEMLGKEDPGTIPL
jgi:7-cyano-7-deazaguanine synthase in queuosine biosynthesis